MSVDRATLQTKYKNVYALGDVTALPIPGRWKPDVPMMLPKAGVFPQPSKVSVISPDYPDAIELPFSIVDGFICFTVPSLHVWGVLVIE